MIDTLEQCAKFFKYRLCFHNKAADCNNPSEWWNALKRVCILSASFFVEYKSAFKRPSVSFLIISQLIVNLLTSKWTSLQIKAPQRCITSYQYSFKIIDEKEFLQFLVGFFYCWSSSQRKRHSAPLNGKNSLRISTFNHSRYCMSSNCLSFLQLYRLS